MFQAYGSTFFLTLTNPITIFLAFTPCDGIGLVSPRRKLFFSGNHRIGVFLGSSCRVVYLELGHEPEIVSHHLLAWYGSIGIPV